MAMRKYFDKWRLNKRLLIHEIKNQHVEQLFIAAFQKHQIFYKSIIGGNEADKKRKSLGIIDRWWINQKHYYIQQWYKNTLN